MKFSEQIRILEGAALDLERANNKINFIDNKDAGLFLDDDKLAEGIKISEKIDTINTLIDNIREIHFDAAWSKPVGHAEVVNLERTLSSEKKEELAKAIKDGSIKTSKDLEVYRTTKK